MTTDGALVSRTPVIFARSYNRGRLESRIVAPGRGEVKLHDWPNAPDWPLRGTRVGIEVGLSVAGRRNVQATCTRTRDRSDVSRYLALKDTRWRSWLFRVAARGDASMR